MRQGSSRKALSAIPCTGMSKEKGPVMEQAQLLRRKAERSLCVEKSEQDRGRKGMTSERDQVIQVLEVKAGNLDFLTF